MAGSIEKRGENCWRLVVSAGKKADGQRVKCTKVFHGSKREADKALALFIAEVERNDYIKPGKLFVKEFLLQWLKDYGAPNLAPQTYGRYEQLLRLYAFDTVGNYHLDQIKPPHFSNLYNSLQGKLSGTTVLQLHRILHKAFKTACEWLLINKSPLENVKPPKKDETEIPFLTEEDAAIMLINAQTDEPLWFFALVSLGVIGGLRRGELLALQWSDINFEKSSISINHSLQRITGKGLSFKEPKTKKSRRSLALPLDLMELLKQHKVDQNKKRLEVGDMWENNDLVFAGTFGKPMDPDYVSHLFRNFITKNGLPPVTLHGLRHSAASIMISKGIHAKGISSRLGHSGIQITMNTYGRFFESADRDAADKMTGMIPIGKQKGM